MFAPDTKGVVKNIKLMQLRGNVREAEMYFSTSYPVVVQNIKQAYRAGNIEKVIEGLKKLPTKDKLLGSLLEKLKGKPVHKTLIKFLKEEKLDREVELKGLFSLGTHIVIECQKGNKCYEVLLPYVYERLGTVLFSK